MLSGSYLNGLTSVQLPVYEPLFRYSEMKSLDYKKDGIVYGLCGPDRKIFYIGCTTNPNFRFSGTFPHSSNVKVMNRIISHGSDLMVCVIASGSNSRFAKLFKLETDLIMYHGDNLLNDIHNGFVQIIKKRFHKKINPPKKVAIA